MCVWMRLLESMLKNGNRYQITILDILKSEFDSEMGVSYDPLQ